MAKLQFKVKALVTVPLLKISDNGTPSYVKFTSAIFKATENEAEAKKFQAALKKYNEVMAGTDEEAKREAKAPQAPNPPMLAHIVNLETGEVQQIICGSVLESELNAAYPEDAYIGKTFEIKKQKPTGNKKYAMYEIAEIEVEGDVGNDAPEVAGKNKAKKAA